MLIGPAGAGKSHTMGVLAQTWRDQFGGRVLGVATSQIATLELADNGLESPDTAKIDQSPPRGIDPAPAGMAMGRIALGVLGLAAPGTLARLFRLRPSPDLDYMNRVFAGRAIALGVGYLTEPAAHRRHWQQLCLFVDSADTLAVLAHLVRRDLHVRPWLPLEWSPAPMCSSARHVCVEHGEASRQSEAVE